AEVSDLGFKIRNPNIEIRNKSEIRITKIRNVRALWFGFVSNFDIRICFGFRYSDFGFAPQQHIGWLQIAMDDALLMGSVDGSGERFRKLGGRRGGPRRTVQTLCQAAAGDVFE